MKELIDREVLIIRERGHVITTVTKVTDTAIHTDDVVYQILYHHEISWKGMYFYAVTTPYGEFLMRQV